MSCLLAFDTSTEFGSVALVTPSGLITRFDKLGNTHSEYMLPWIDEVLQEAGIKGKDLDGIVFGAGPGSFTGLRIACGLAQGLGYGWDKKVLPVSTLAALAYQFKNQAKRIAVLNDARMSECYAAVFEMTDGVLNVVTAEQLIKPSQVGQWLAEYQSDFVVGTAVGVYEMPLPQKAQFVPMRAEYLLDYAQGLASELQDAWVSPDAAAPLYVRDRVALTIKERQAGERL